MPLRCRLLAIVSLVSACEGRSRPSEARPAPAGVDSQPRLVAIAVSVEGGDSPSVPPPSGRPPARGAEYERAVRASFLPDAREGPPVRPTASDDTDLSNYQGGGGRMFVDEEDIGRVPVRFFTNFDRFTSGVVIVTVDTTLDGHRQRPPFDSRMADSIAVAGLRPRERVATTCRFGTYDRDERIIGVLRSDARQRWMPARIAWFLDTTAVRIRNIRPTSVTCIRDEGPD
jgi:hypothetical protein